MNDDAVSQLMRANLFEVFNEPDAERRAAAIDRTYTTTVRWTDDEGVTTGRDELAAKAETLQAQLVGLEFVASGLVQQTRGFGYLAWELRPPGGATAVTGFDAALIADGRISELFTVITHLAD